MIGKTPGARYAALAQGCSRNSPKKSFAAHSL
jgi:hypothetical protein